MAGVVVDQQRMTAELCRRDFLYVLGVEVVAVASQQKLEVECREPSESGFVEVFLFDLRLGLGEKFIVVLPENRPVRHDCFEALPVEMMGQLACELVESVEVAVEVVAAVVRADETTSVDEFRSVVVSIATTQ